MIVADTTVWIDFLRGRETPGTTALRRAVADGLILLGDMILLEILQGVRDDAQAARVERALRSHPLEPMLTPALAPKAAANYRRLRAEGVTIRKTVDLVIGTFCIEGGHVLLHADHDFDPMRDRLGLRVLEG